MLFGFQKTSPFSVSALCERWDDRTSSARFAGNDADMDNVFVAERKGTRVRLVRKARNALDPFATVFRGNIKKDGEGSVLEGWFGKSALDYILLALLFGGDVFFFVRGIVLGQLNGGLVAGCLLFLALLVLLAYPTKSARNRYAEFMSDILGIEENGEK